MKYSLYKIVKLYYNTHYFFWTPVIVADAFRRYLGFPDNVELSYKSVIGLCEVMGIKNDVIL